MRRTIFAPALALSILVGSFAGVALYTSDQPVSSIAASAMESAEVQEIPATDSDASDGGGADPVTVVAPDPEVIEETPAEVPADESSVVEDPAPVVAAEVTSEDQDDTGFSDDEVRVCAIFGFSDDECEAFTNPALGTVNVAVLYDEMDDARIVDVVVFDGNGEQVAYAPDYYTQVDQYLTATVDPYTYLEEGGY